MKLKITEAFIYWSIFIEVLIDFVRNKPTISLPKYFSGLKAWNKAENKRTLKSKINFWASSIAFFETET